MTRTSTPLVIHSGDCAVHNHKITTLIREKHMVNWKRRAPPLSFSLAEQFATALTFRNCIRQKSTESHTNICGQKTALVKRQQIHKRKDTNKKNDCLQISAWQHTLQQAQTVRFGNPTTKYLKEASANTWPDTKSSFSTKIKTRPVTR